MTKTQGWIAIVLLAVIIILWMVHNQTEFQKGVNRNVACQDICYDNYQKTYPNETSEQLQKCVEACNLTN